MSTLEEVLSRNTVPSRIVRVPLDCFSDTWAQKPMTPPSIGLRIPSEADVQQARAQAERKAKDMHKKTRDRVASYNDALMRWIVARGTSSTEDVRQPYFVMAEHTVNEALTTDGVRFLYGEIERFALEHSPLVAPATDAQVLSFAEKLTAEAPFALMSTARERRARRLIAYLMEELVRPERENG